MKYKSKIDWWFHLLIALFALFTVYAVFGALKGDPTLAVASLMLFFMFFLFLLPTYLWTYYFTGEKELTVRSGLFTKKVIPYEMIVSLEPGSVTGDSAALSRDRLVLTYYKDGRKKRLLLSPKDKFDFTTEIKLKTAG